MTAKVLRTAGVALCLAACAKQAAPPPPSPVATVGSQGVSRELFDYYVAQKTGVAAATVDSAVKASLLQELDRLKTAADAEESRADPTTQLALQLQRIELLAHAGATAAGVYAAPSDADLKAEYDRFVAALPAKEFHVAHILVATESAAQVLIVALQGGADFATTAAEQSADDSKARGGDLGWVSPGKLPVEFTNAVQTLKPGGITAHPVHTIYGWHVIKLLESRPAAAPPFEQVKAQIAANLQQSRYQRFLEESTWNAKK